jgi:hypothetical protein
MFGSAPAARLAIGHSAAAAWQRARALTGRQRAPQPLPAPARPRPAAGVTRRPVTALTLAELHGGTAEPPRRLWWSGSPTVDLDDLGQAAVFYESALDAGSPADLADWLNADLLTALWPSLGMSRARQAAWEGANPQLAALTAAASAAA